MDNMLTDNLLISQAGCALTSATMVFNKYGVSKNPREFNAAMGDKACPFYWYEAVSRAGEGKVSLQEGNVRLGKDYYDPLKSEHWVQLANALQADRLPIIELTWRDTVKQVWRMHWVVVFKVSGSCTDKASYQIVDPNGGIVRSLTDYTVGKSAEVTSLVIYEPTGQ